MTLHLEFLHLPENVCVNAVQNIRKLLNTSEVAQSGRKTNVFPIENTFSIILVHNRMMMSGDVFSGLRNFAFCFFPFGVCSGMIRVHEGTGGRRGGGGHRGHGPTFGSWRWGHIVIWPHLWHEREKIKKISWHSRSSRVPDFHVFEGEF